MITEKPSTPVSELRYLKGVGPKRALALEKIGIGSIKDLFYFFPRRYEDRSSFRNIGELELGQACSLRAEILSSRIRPLKRMLLLEVTVGDSTGMIRAVWFNQPYLKNQFVPGKEVILYGKLDYYTDRLQMSSPEYEIIDCGEEAIHTGRITPVYPLTEGLFQRSLRKTLYELIHRQMETYLSEHLPLSFRTSNRFMELREAVREIHFPTSLDKQAEARRRLAFDELFLFELLLLNKMEAVRTKYQSRPLPGGAPFFESFQKSLPFTLTPGQISACKNLIRDLAQTNPMNRLLHGDVGSGKTTVAAFALALAAHNRFQGAFLVPTELLAEQHFKTLGRTLKSFDLSMGLLTASTPSAAREKMLAALHQGKLSIVVGTHALLQEAVKFRSLAVLVIDEQHKFGVHQRCHLLNISPRPHQLVMTATPIPRTLALTVFGDLDISAMKELPRGRKPIATYWIVRDKQPEILRHIREKAKKGEQAYFIFPLIEETEKPDLLAAKREFEKLRKGVFADVKMGLVHGRLSGEDRERVMQAFRDGNIAILVATSVVEVGVDNPNATMMVIENAERFGLAQLHQMRGRIGRGTRPSECFLFGEPKTIEGQKRLRILTKTQDGFVISEEDLRLRGPGEFLGTRQSGAPLFRIADPLQDQDLLSSARETALSLVKQNLLAQSPEWSETQKILEQSTIQY